MKNNYYKKNLPGVRDATRLEPCCSCPTTAVVLLLQLLPPPILLCLNASIWPFCLLCACLLHLVTILFFYLSDLHTPLFFILPDPYAYLIRHALHACLPCLVLSYAACLMPCFYHMLSSFLHSHLMLTPCFSTYVYHTCSMLF